MKENKNCLGIDPDEPSRCCIYKIIGAIILIIFQPLSLLEMPTSNWNVPQIH